MEWIQNMNSSNRTIKSAKSGFVTSYNSPKNGKALLNYVFRKTGVKMRIYAAGIGEYTEILADFPDNMKKDIVNAGECKELNGFVQAGEQVVIIDDDYESEVGNGF